LILGGVKIFVMASSYFNILGFRKDVSVVWRRRETDPAAVDADHADVRVVPGPRARPAPVNHADDPCRGRSSSATRTGEHLFVCLFV